MYFSDKLYNKTDRTELGGAFKAFTPFGNWALIYLSERVNRRGLVRERNTGRFDCESVPPQIQRRALVSCVSRASVPDARSSPISDLARNELSGRFEY